MANEFTVDYFITKFTNTRDDKWVINTLHNSNQKSCANGWCGVSVKEDTFYVTDESIALAHLLKPLATGKVKDNSNDYSNIAAGINNGDHPKYQQPHPKQRILAALHDIKRLQQPTKEEPAVKTKYIAVDAPIRETVKELLEVPTN